MSTHQRPNLLARSLRSLLNQTTQDFQIVLCADEGTRATKEVASALLRPTDSFLALPHLHGPAETRNVGTVHAVADRIMFLDDDDSFDVDFIEKLRTAVESAPLEKVLFFDYCRIEEEPSEAGQIEISRMKVPQADKNPATLMVGNFIPSNSFCVATNLARRVSFDPHLASHEDWDFLIGLSKLAPFQWKDITGPNVHVSRDQTRNSSSHRLGSVGLDFLSIYRKWPTTDTATRQGRQDQLQAYGLRIPLHFL